MSVLDTLGSVKEYIGWDKHQIDDAIFRQGFSIKLSILNSKNTADCCIFVKNLEKYSFI